MQRIECAQATLLVGEDLLCDAARQATLPALTLLTMAEKPPLDTLPGGECRTPNDEELRSDASLSPACGTTALCVPAL